LKISTLKKYSMNSKKLKNKHKNIYQNFFMENNLVISLPLLLNWAWDIFDNYEWIRIKQKIPLRIYLWINFIDKKEIKFNKINYYDLNERKFIENNLLEHASIFSKLKEYVNNKYSKNILEKWWLEINFLSETSRWMWLWFWSVISMLLFIWLEKFYNNINYINTEKIIINDFLNINTPIDNLLRISLEANKIIWTKFSVENQITSFFDSYYPIVSFKENIDSEIKNIDINSVKIYWYRLNNIEKNLSSVPFLPLDYWLVYSWRPVLVDHILNTNNESFTWTKNIKQKVKKYFWKNIDEILPIRKPKFYSTFIEPEDDIFKETYGRIMWAISLEILNIILKLYSAWYTESNMVTFIGAINKIRHWNYITRKTSKSFTVFLDNIFSNFKLLSWILWLAPNDTNIMGWNAIFVLPLEWYRKEFLDSVEATKKNISWVKIIYANWLDWLESKWFKVEQDLKNNIYSEFVNKNSLILENNLWITKIIDSDYLNIENLDWLTLDLIKRKIYLDWEKLTSKQIHSQNTTIDILEILLKNIWEDISNKELPKSSYSINKNEMLWKIILPLVKLIEEKKKIKLALICKWSINDFYLKLKSSDLSINIIKKLS